MTQTEKDLCNCLGCVLNHEPSIPLISDFKALLRTADHHAVTALLADLPIETLNGAERNQRLQLISNAIALETQHQTMNQAIVNAVRKLEMEGIGYYLLKGQNCAVRYPHPERRQIGDIDLYVEPIKFDYATRLFKRQGFYKKESTMLHLSMSNGDGIELELHHDLQRLQWPRHDCALRRMCSYATLRETITLADTQVRVLPQELDIVVLCVHTMSHLYCSGIGLRHVCDYMMRVRWALDRNLDVERLEQMLHEVGAYRVYCVLNYICNTYLHASLPLPMAEKYGENVFKRMLHSGNFSHDIDLGAGIKRFIRFYGSFLWHCITLFPISPLESLAWPIMKLKRAIRNEAHRKT